MNARFGGIAALRAALMMTGSTYVAYGLGLVISALIARSLGPEDFGRYSYVVWLSGVLVMLANNGLTTSGIRFVSESLGRDAPDTAARVHGWLLLRQHASALVVAAGFMLLLPFLKPAGWDRGLWVFAAAVVVSFVAKTYYLFDVSIAKGHGRFSIEAVSTVALVVLNLLVVVALGQVHAGLLAYVGLFVALSAGYLMMVRVMLGRASIAAAKGVPDGEVLGRLRKHLFWTVLLITVGVLTNKSIETFLLNATAGAAAVGFFTIAAALTRGGVEVLSSGLNTVLMPAMSHAFGAGGRERVGVIVSDAVRYFQFLGLVLAGVGLLWSKAVVLLLYGQNYLPAVDVLRIMLVTGGVVLTDAAFGALLSTTDHQRLRVFVILFSVVVTAALALVLVPAYGLLGAAFAHGISRIASFVAGVAAMTRVIRLDLPYGALARLFGAAALGALAAAPLVFLVGGPWAEAAGGLVYALVLLAGSILLGAWTRRDFSLCLGLARRYARLTPLADAVERRLLPLARQD